MTAAPACRKETRRQKTRDRGLNGIDFIEVLCPEKPVTPGSPVELCVHLFGKEVRDITAANIRIEGGTRIRDIRVKKGEEPVIIHDDSRVTGDCLRLPLNKQGDLSTYTLSLVDDKDGEQTDRPLPGFDPRYSSASFSFAACCSTDLDCKKEEPCLPEMPEEPVIDYLNKDYAGFRQLILDRLALLMPEWKEEHIPDIGITLVELLAYAGDYLSYRQDAVATEAYLGTAGHRISVKRHARLVDYAMHEGCNARAFVCMTVSGDTTDPLHPDDMFFVTRADALDVPEGTVLTPDNLKDVPVSEYEVFEPLFTELDPLPLYAAYNEIRFYTWGDQECCIPEGATSATLVDEWIEEQDAKPGRGEERQHLTHLVKPETEPGSEQGEPEISQTNYRRKLGNLMDVPFLLFEEVIGPGTGNPADADPVHRQVVRLTNADYGIDPLNGQPVVEITWAAEDALTFPLCLSATLTTPDCTYIGNISIARGNVIPVDHGRRTESDDLGTAGTDTTEGRCDCRGLADITVRPGPFRPVLPEKPVTFRQNPDPETSASRIVDQDVTKALAQVVLTGRNVSAPAAAAFAKTSWYPVQDLLDCREQDQVFVVEVNDEGCASIRFGDGEQGKMPPAGTSFSGRYRTGNGPEGNVGSGMIRYLGLRNTRLSGITVGVRNPLPATGGTAPESPDDVRLLAPHAYKKRLERAITAADYAGIAMRNPKIQNAAAALRWTGSWYEARVAVDPRGTELLMPALDAEIEGDLYRFRRMGHDLAVVTAKYIPLKLRLSVCVKEDFLPEQVRAALMERFSNRVLPDGSYGFFHPDRLTFDGGISTSSIQAEALAVPGVRCVVAGLKRLFDNDSLAIRDGVLRLGADEIAQLDNDPNFPEHGLLEIITGGGR